MNFIYTLFFLFFSIPGFSEVSDVSTLIQKIKNREMAEAQQLVKKAEFDMNGENEKGDTVALALHSLGEKNPSIDLIRLIDSLSHKGLKTAGDIHAFIERQKERVFIEAVKRGNKSQVLEMIGYGIDINKKINLEKREVYTIPLVGKVTGKSVDEFVSPIDVAISHQKAEMVGVLLKNGVKIPSIDVIKVIDSLIREGLKTDGDIRPFIERQKERVFVEAIKQGDESQVLEIIDYGIDINKKMKLENQRIEKSPLPLVGKVVAKNAYEFISPIDVAISHQREEMVDILLKNGAKTSEHNMKMIENQSAKPASKPLIFQAIERNNMEKLKALLKDPKVNINQLNEKKETPLMVAIRQGNKAMVEDILNHPKVNVNLKSHGGETAIHYVILFSQTEKLLSDILNHPKLNLRIVNSQGQTSFHLAAFYGDLDAIIGIGNKIIETDSEPLSFLNLRDKLVSSTAFMLAAGRNNTDAIKTLFKFDVDVNIPDIFGRSPLHYLAEMGNVEGGEQILKDRAANMEKVVKLNGLDNKGWPPLFYAALTKNKGALTKKIDFIKLLLKEPDIDVEIKDKKGRSVFDLMANKEDFRLVVQTLGDYKKGKEMAAAKAKAAAKKAAAKAKAAAEKAEAESKAAAEKAEEEREKARAAEEAKEKEASDGSKSSGKCKEQFRN